MDNSLTDYWNDLLSWGGIVLLLTGMKLIGEKRFSGFIVSIASRILWLIWAYRFHATALVVMNVAMVLAYFRNIFLWQREKKKSLSLPTTNSVL
jgi:hypothetical protein